MAFFWCNLIIIAIDTFNVFEYTLADCESDVKLFEFVDGPGKDNLIVVQETYSNDCNNIFKRDNNIVLCTEDYKKMLTDMQNNEKKDELDNSHYKKLFPSFIYCTTQEEFHQKTKLALQAKEIAYKYCDYLKFSSNYRTNDELFSIKEFCKKHNDVDGDCESDLKLFEFVDGPGKNNLIIVHETYSNDCNNILKRDDNVVMCTEDYKKMLTAMQNNEKKDELNNSYYKKSFIPFVYCSTEEEFHEKSKLVLQAKEIAYKYCNYLILSSKGTNDEMFSIEEFCKKL